MSIDKDSSLLYENRPRIGRVQIDKIEEVRIKTDDIEVQK